MAKKPCKKQIKQGIESLCICQTVNLSKETLAVSDVSRVWENLFRSSGSPGFQVPNSELPEPLGTTQNGWEATLPKVIPACVQPLHTTASHVPFTLLPVKLSSSLFLAHIYTSSTVFSLSCLASFWQLAEVCFHTYCLVTILIVLAWALLPSIYFLSGYEPC